ncbi:hypothetical protein K443DRAFT_118547 [Laccaria amethystina LaAM-08-1]|uniref:Uncharacterized protein n=1 Tax=Laccaria amethystina LaAM-08-1 TaxID=1095629 RepID=A0A0C9YNN8_9AGAR|nr:hypothetical protein K443DRAFT_118547 [Laccaria amethystina LaAM-08-1]
MRCDATIDMSKLLFTNPLDPVEALRPLPTHRYQSSALVRLPVPFIVDSEDKDTKEEQLWGTLVAISRSRWPIDASSSMGGIQRKQSRAGDSKNTSRIDVMYAWKQKQGYIHDKKTTKPRSSLKKHRRNV